MDRDSLGRLFHLITVVSGQAFSKCFLEYCVASLLSPGNLPALKSRQRSKFLIATLPSDWAFMNSTPIFRALTRYVEPVSKFLHAPEANRAASTWEWRPVERRSERILRFCLGMGFVALRPVMALYKHVTGLGWTAHQDRGIQRDAKGDHLGAAADFAEAIRIGPPNPALRRVAARRRPTRSCGRV
jgi:hypothetical protein